MAIALVIRSIHGAGAAALGEEQDGVGQKGGGGERHTGGDGERWTGYYIRYRS